MSVAKEIAEYRDQKKISLRALGKLSGVRYERICQIENGRVPISFEDLVKLCKALEVPSDLEQRWIGQIRENIFLVS